MAQLQFKGKTFVQNHHLLVKYHELIPVKAKSLTDRVTLHDNLIIHGDNLKGLKALLPLYAGKVKCVYIDPPYNTGNEKWVYNDNVSSPMMQDWLGKVVDREDLTRHDKWLCMMMPRLKLIRELMADDGLIFISIDDNENAHLRLLMDEIFSCECFIACLIWKSRQHLDSRTLSGVSVDHEYILVYAKNAGNARLLGQERDESKYSNPDDDPRGLWMSRSILGLATKEQRPNLHYVIVDQKTGVRYPCPPDTGWRYSQETMMEKINEKRILFPKKQEGRVREKVFLNELKGATTGLASIIDDIFTAHGSHQIREIFGDQRFEFPKPSSLVRRLISQVSGNDFIVLDSFAGSGPTAQAVLELNKEDGGNRRFILVECEDYADSITAERVRRVIARQVEAASPPLARLAKKSGLETASTASTVVYFDPQSPIGFVKGGNLPHWRQDGATYFVTWRTADSMPAKRVEQWAKEREEWLAAHPEPHDVETKAEYDRLFPARWERWLDEGHGECLLRRAEIKAIVEAALRRVEATSSSLRKTIGGDAASAAVRYRLGEFVVMPNHVHVLVTPLGKHRLSDIVQAWKSFTAHAINKALGGRGTFWQKESFDHIVRSPAQLEQITRYIRDQAVEAAPAPLQGKPSGGDAASTNLPSFSYFDLGKPLELESILEGDSMPTYEELARYVFYTATGEEFDPAFAKASPCAKPLRRDKSAGRDKADDKYKNFIGESRNYQVFLFYEPDVAKLKNLAFTLDMAKALPKLKEGKRRLVFAPTKYLDQEHLDQFRIDFAQLPFEIYELTK